MLKLKCCSCKELKDEEEFSRSKDAPKRNYRTYRCRVCDSFRDRNVEKKPICCEICLEYFDGWKNRKICGKKDCKRKRALQNSKKCEKKRDYTEKNKKDKQINRAMLKLATRNEEPYTEEELKVIMERKRGKYVYSSKELGLRFSRSKRAIDSKRGRLRREKEKR